MDPTQNTTTEATAEQVANLDLNKKPEGSVPSKQPKSSKKDEKYLLKAAKVKIYKLKKKGKI